MPEFMLLSRAFRIGKHISGSYSAQVVASSAALYLVVGQNAIKMGLAAVGGAVGGLIAGLMERNRSQPALAGAAPRVLETDLRELPAEVTAHPDWPVKATTGRVLVISRADIESIRYSFWDWGIFVVVDGLEFRIEPPMFGRKRKLAWLREAGWAV